MSVFLSNNPYVNEDVIDLCARLKALRVSSNWQPSVAAKTNQYYMELPSGVQVDQYGDPATYEAFVYCDLKHDGLNAGPLNALVFSLSAEAVDATLDIPTRRNIIEILAKELANAEEISMGSREGSADSRATKA